MKKVISFFLALLMIIPMAAVAFATDVSIYVITQNEQLFVQQALEDRGLFGAGLSVELIYDTLGEPRFLFGATQEGYIIIERGTGVIHECGQGNPFTEYMSSKKYYGGPLCYFVEPNANQNALDAGTPQYYDIVKTAYLDDMYALEFRNTPTPITNPMSANEDTTVRVIDSYLYIQRRAFGVNDNDTCSATATGIALTYMALEHNSSIVPTAWTAELRDGVDDSEEPANYTKAQSLCDYLREDCEMGPISYGDGIRYPILLYIQNKVPDSCNLDITWTLAPQASTIKSHIEADMPVLITTTIAGEFSGHTMAVYGYRELSGSKEILVHTGWYSSEYNDVYTSGGVHHYWQLETWISEGYATYGYYFSLG